MRSSSTTGVANDRTLRIKLTQPIPIFLEAIARGSASIPFIIPEHVARTDPFTQVTDATGSGPYRFVKEEFIPGQLAVYVRNKDYIPASGPADWTSGAKIAHFERLEWQALPEQATAAAALRSGQIDWYEQVQPDLVPSLRAHPEIRIGNANPTGFNGILRFNHLQAPFNNQAIRRAVLLAVNQQDYMQALTGGDPTSYANCRSMFPCGTPTVRIRRCNTCPPTFHAPAQPSGPPATTAPRSWCSVPLTFPPSTRWAKSLPTC
ncbi:ABC transporter substrate-binding protein [Siccirubricoccus deserti]